MTRRMQQAIDRLRTIPESEQDALADFVLHELANNERWAKTTREHAENVRRLMEDVLRDDAHGRTEPLDPERL